MQPPPVVFTDEWRSLLARQWSLWGRLTDDERAHIERMTPRFIAEKRWEAANGFELTEPMQVLIAAQACLLLLGFVADTGDDPADADDAGVFDLYRGVGTVLVHPTTVVLEGQRATGTAGLVSSDPYAIAGQAAFGGPTVLAWDAVVNEARHPGRGENVVYHEFAHKLDMLDGVLDGTPPMVDGAARQRWIEVCTREFRALSRGLGGPLLRDYGAENPAEFFAVATEVFFTKPVSMRADKPDLYAALAGFYRQDPASRFPAPVPGELPIVC